MVMIMMVVVTILMIISDDNDDHDDGFDDQYIVIDCQGHCSAGDSRENHCFIPHRKINSLRENLIAVCKASLKLALDTNYSAHQFI